MTQPSEFVYNLELNRPKKMNALSMEMWGEIGDFFERVGEDSDCRVVVLSAAGNFTIFKKGWGFDNGQWFILVPKVLKTQISYVGLNTTMKIDILFMYADKVMLAAGLNNDTPHPPYWINKLANKWGPY